MRTIAWIIIGCICIGLVSYGVFGYGDDQASAEISQEAAGQFVRMDDDGKKIVMTVGGQQEVYPVSSTVWVYRDNQKSGTGDLQSGDTLDVILNSKHQVAYIKAASTGQASSAASEAPEASGAPAREREEASLSAPSAQKAPMDSATGDQKLIGPELPQGSFRADEAPAAGIAGSPVDSGQQPRGDAASGAGASASPPVSANAGGWEKLSFDWKSRGFELKVKQEPGKQGASSKGKSELYLKTDDRSVIHLDGNEADSFIRTLMQGLPMEPKSFEQALKQKIASEFRLKSVPADWKVDVKWPEKKPADSNPPGTTPGGKVKGYDKNKEKANDYGKGKYGARDD
ncbi:hypothetical protein N0M98_05205 [Paenibacillus doosanensis]|uniref:hypothetical protein n=1 Tax=Paenibacillus doosanensis TaxID=1229154 RepID=UPI0021805FCA|nr:hypothetical protein [Paenibacillus doosanensis]MCS7459531.1 hypothetical protein [Paenibacillus doosanensis]